MNRESYDELYNGPRHHEPVKTGTLGEIGSDTDSAFALGRELYNGIVTGIVGAKLLSLD